LSNKPTIPAAQVNADWNATTGVAQILNKPTIPSAQIQSDFNQTDSGKADFIKNKPAIYVKKVYNATLTATWTGSAGNYSQDVTVTGLAATDIPVVDVVLSDDAPTAKSQLQAWSSVGRAVTAANKITARCYEDSALTMALNIQMLV
jgi:hypothetical protein